jgi:hypothetical protein
MPLHSNLPEPSLATFPDSYADARILWRRHLSSLSVPAGQRSFSAQHGAPDGAPLATDIAWVGTADAANLLVILGGTHGIEGFAGTAVICDLLTCLAQARLPGNLAVLCVHALNPWG